MENEEKLLRRYENMLKRLPPGRLCIMKKEWGDEYYYVDEKTGKRIYINKENAQLINDLKLKRFLQLAIRILRRNIVLQKEVLEKYRLYAYDSIQGLLAATYKSEIQAKAAGASSSTFREEQKKHMTTAGFKVRSKSEAMIVEILSSKEIPFQYEEPLTLYKDGNPVIVHPDFTFTNRHGEKIFWEHMGMMDVEEYRKRALDKLAVFWENGIVPPHNLILSSETGDGSLDVATIAMIADMVQKML